MTEDLIDIYDENMNLLGTASVAQAHQEGLWHKSFHCWIAKRAANHNHKIWIQLRRQNQDNSSLKLDISAAEHIKTGQEPKACIIQTQKELGIFIPSDKLNKLFTARHINARRDYKNYEFCPTYLYETDSELTDLKPNKNLVGGIFETGLKDLQNLFNKKVSKIFIGGFKIDKAGIMQPHTGSVNINDFVAHDIKYYQKALKTIENYFEGKPLE